MSKEASLKTSTRFIRFAFGILALLQLCFALSSFEGLVARYQDELSLRVALANWGPPLLMIFFGLGWFTVHVIEIALQRTLFKQAVLILILWAVAVLIWNFNPFFVNLGFINDMSSPGSLLAMTGSVLRYSVFSTETISIVQQRMGSLFK